MQSATVIARGAGSTTIVHSDTVAARLVQSGLKEKRAGEVAAKPPVPTIAPSKRRAKRPDLSKQGIDALRSGVQRVSAAIDWLVALAISYEGEAGYVYVMADDGGVARFATEVLDAARIDPSTFTRGRRPGTALAAYDPDAAPRELPIPATIGRVEGLTQLDLKPQRHLSLIRWGDGDDQIEIARTSAMLTLSFAGKDHLTLMNPDHAGSIGLRLGDRHVTLREDPMPLSEGILDVIL